MHIKKAFLVEEGVLFSVVIIHAFLSSNWLAGNNDNDDHDERNSPIELRHDVTDFVIVFVYPHGGTVDLFISTNVLVNKVKNNTGANILRKINPALVF
ncbi:hypothetical protein EGT74_20780 [Chitinophaga lutea]|uniref:Uncharacterized protein n=1 Tax=Chitinophaga lutea TaxID=2488634 RepID=A0A3N4PL74_9BACT|nr:hypothetical protein [Chitinophaga lutea]RPE09432.1 hypothetical protein EGT74_20780 [Chitinophaga lutea]